jgi:protein-S-isoprenylcysteine O-methyltransferase Ste14
MASFVKVFLAFCAYGAIHSLLLTHESRLLIEAIVGQRMFRGWFRLAYTVLAVVLFLILIVYAATLPDFPLLSIYGPPAWFLLCLRLGGLVLILWCLQTLRWSFFLGIENLRAWREGRVPDNDGVDTRQFVKTGPYRTIRHPMYAGAFLLLWAVPHWTLNLLAFCLSASCYLWIGSLHEERRLLKAYGDEYRDYMARTPRFLPRLSQQRRPEG